jgi:enoyl-CoA hydratase/carnithine racemase
VPPSLPDVCNRIEACSKPVVAALQGAALGGGLEVALGAHYRLALPAVKVGLPEVDLGLMPGAGGTQRAPRLMGVKAAAEFMLSGKPIGAQAALQAGLVDRIVDTANAGCKRWGQRRHPPRIGRRSGLCQRTAGQVRPCAVCATSPSLTPKPRWPS